MISAMVLDITGVILVKVTAIVILTITYVIDSLIAMTEVMNQKRAVS